MVRSLANRTFQLRWEVADVVHAPPPELVALPILSKPNVVWVEETMVSVAWPVPPSLPAALTSFVQEGISFPLEIELQMGLASSPWKKVPHYQQSPRELLQVIVELPPPTPESIQFRFRGRLVPAPGTLVSDFSPTTETQQTIPLMSVPKAPRRPRLV